jgi:hypothetical protein
MFPNGECFHCVNLDAGEIFGISIIANCFFTTATHSPDITSECQRHETICKGRGAEMFQNLETT